MMKQEKIDERLRWACRRGMLELDLFLLPFFEHYQMDEAEKALFARLLEAPDPYLFALFMNRCQPAQEFVSLVQKIRAFRLTHR